MTDRPAKPAPLRGGLLYETHALEGGLTVRLRLVRAGDEALVRELLEGCSAESLQLRFFAAMPVISLRTVRHFTHYDPRSGTVVCASVADGGRERLVALGDVAVDGPAAEAAVLVADAFQGRGLGRLVTTALVAEARRRGAERLVARLLTRNLPMRRVLERLGPVRESVEDGNSVLTLAIPPVSGARRAA